MNLSLNLSRLLALCKTNMDDLVDSGNSSVRGDISLIQKDSVANSRVLQFM